ncbi:NfeD family protein [Verrucomicrobiota bacterium]
MIHHPVILVPKLVVLGIIIIVLITLHGILSPSQFRAAVAAGVVLFIAASVAIWIVAAKLLANPDSKIAKATVLSHEAKAEDGFKASSDQFASLVGKRGVAVSNLNPAGTALVEEKRIPVMTDGEFIEATSPVIVVQARGAKVVVRGLKAETTS